MKLEIDTDAALITVTEHGTRRQLPLAMPEAFDLVSRAWLRAGWDVKQVYSFTWFGRPIIQLPEDMVRTQELIYQLKPDVIIETGVAHGGSLVFYASLCRLFGKGRVIGVESDLRPHNRRAVETHPLADLITLIEGDSVARDTVSRVAALLTPGERTMVFLDSRHTKSQVMAELDAYAPFVSFGSYIVATDGIMEMLAGAPRSEPDWRENNPLQAVREWLTQHPEFALVEPDFMFNEGVVTRRVTYWPDGFIKRVR